VLVAAVATACTRLAARHVAITASSLANRLVMMASRISTAERPRRLPAWDP